MVKWIQWGIVLCLSVSNSACEFMPPGNARKPAAKAQRSVSDVLADGRRHSETKEYDRAIADYSEYIQLIPNDPFGYLKRGVVRHAAGKHREAISDYTRALELEKAANAGYGAGLHYNRANVYRDLGEYDKAIADYDEAVRIDPKYQHAIVSRGSVRNSKGDYDRAIADLDLALKIDPTDVIAYQHRAYARTRTRVYVGAVSDYGEAIKLRKDSPIALNGRAWLLATCADASVRNGEQAVQDALRACELTAWKDASNLDTLAAAYAESGNSEKAVEWQAKALELTPKDQKAALQSRLDLYQSGKPYHDSQN